MNVPCKILGLIVAVCFFTGQAGSLQTLHAQDGSAKYDSLRQSFGEPLSPFTLTDQDGKPFSSAELKGKVWLVHFFFTTCIECNKLSPVVAELQERIRGKPDLAMVSISLNHDSAADLKKFAAGLKAEPGQWIFLTGDRKTVHGLVQTAFHQTAMPSEDPSPGKEIAHSFNLVIVDRDGSFEGYADSRDAGVAGRIQERMSELAGRRYLLPAMNAGLNGLCTVLLLVGYLTIRKRWVLPHKICMLAALATSAAFLSSYLYFHFVVLGGQPTRFLGTGWVRVTYFSILLTHTILAVIVAPLALTVTYLGLRDRLARHVRLARWTLPAWLYVSITGVVVYVMLYQLYPPF